MRAAQANGFTLVETIFSTLFIGVAVLAIVNLFPGAYLSIRKSEMRIQTDLIVKSLFDEIRADFEKMTPGAFRGLAPGPYSEVGAPFEPWKVDNMTYIPTVEIFKVPDAEFEVLKGVRVTVEYRIDPNEKSSFAFPPPAVYETYMHKLAQ